MVNQSLTNEALHRPWFSAYDITAGPDLRGRLFLKQACSAMPLSSSASYEHTLSYLRGLLAREPASQPFHIAITAAIRQVEVILAEIREAADWNDI
jgi:hypothetical protein